MELGWGYGKQTHLARDDDVCVAPRAWPGQLHFTSWTVKEKEKGKGKIKEKKALEDWEMKRTNRREAIARRR